jgi:hypothetical protein
MMVMVIVMVSYNEVVDCSNCMRQRQVNRQGKRATTVKVLLKCR